MNSESFLLLDDQIAVYDLVAMFYIILIRLAMVAIAYASSVSWNSNPPYN